MGEGVRAAFGLAGGLALFLFGMENMSRALQQAAGAVGVASPQAPSIKARPSAVQADQVRREEKRWSRFMVFPVGSEGQKGRR